MHIVPPKSRSWVIALAAVLAVAAQAASNPRATQPERSSAASPQRIALVIGNSRYAAVAPLTNPRNDAELMARTLRSLGFQVTELIDADQNTMKQAMLNFGRALRDGVDAGLFYYAGHGVQANGINYLIPVDAVIKDQGELDLQAVDVNAFLRVMEGSASRVNIVILDACRNNPFATGFRSASRGLAPVDAPRGTYIAYSTSPANVAEDGTTGNSPYTLALAAAMQVPDQKLEDTFKQTRRTVLSETHDRQVPWETSSITGDFYFQATAGATAGDPNLGTWILNESKSHLVPSGPITRTVIYEAVGDQVKVIADGVYASRPFHTEWTGRFDGRDYPVVGDQGTRSVVRIDAHTLRSISRNAAGRITSINDAVVSADGRTRTVTSTDANRSFESLSFYDRQ
jgi:hypothetical protein